MCFCEKIFHEITTKTFNEILLQIRNGEGEVIKSFKEISFLE